MGWRKKIGKDNPIKISGTSVQGIVKNQPEVAEVKTLQYVLTYAVCIVHSFWNPPGWNYKNYLTLPPLKIEGQDEAKPSKYSQVIYYLIRFQILLLFRMSRKSPGLENIHFNKEFFPIRTKFKYKLEKCSWTSTTGHHGWLSIVIYNDH